MLKKLSVVLCVLLMPLPAAAANIDFEHGRVGLSSITSADTDRQAARNWLAGNAGRRDRQVPDPSALLVAALGTAFAVWRRIRMNAQAATARSADGLGTGPGVTDVRGSHPARSAVNALPSGIRPPRNLTR